MGGWAGIALALRDAADDAMRSRLPTHLHPLAGRVLAWHVLHALAELEPGPNGLVLAAGSPLDSSVTGELRADVVAPSEDEGGDRGVGRLLGERMQADNAERFLFVDAAAAALSTSLERLVGGPVGRTLRGGDGRTIAVWADAETVADRLDAEDGAALALDVLGDGLSAVETDEPAHDLFVVSDRETLARAGRTVRDRLVRRWMEVGVTFLLPETVLLDVDVTIEPDTIIYPGVVLEGRTRIGSETVVGPSCRIIDSRIGSGVELKGWNYIVGTSVRNRAVLEPYVRRGHD